MSGIKARVAGRFRSSSLSAVPPPRQSSEYSTDLAKAAASILFRSPLPSREGRPIFVLNAAALPDTGDADYDLLLPYVLARLPEEDDLLKGFEYEVVFFAGDGDGSATSRKRMPGWGWFLQAYHVLSRAMRKRLQKLYIVHEKAWVRILTEIFSTIVSPKFRRKIYHIHSLTSLATHISLQDLLIPPSTYLTDRRTSDDIFVPNASGRRAFGARRPFPLSSKGRTHFPRVLRETTSFVLMDKNITSEGLFRVPPHSRLRDVLKEAYDRGQKYIIWKDNGVTLPVPPYPQAEHQEEILAEVHPTDAYSVYMAAALIKAWYAGLRQPIFPQESYRDLKRLYGDSEDALTLERLTDLFSPTSEWSFLPGMSREILVRHLLPLLSEVATHQEQNKMTAENLAVCFAPALLCGPDQVEDAKMSSIIRRILTQAIDLWTQGLRKACGQQVNTFWEELKLPTDQEDWDDPMEPRRASTEDSPDEQVGGITLQDNEKLPEPYPEPDESLIADMPPPLPPRSKGPSTKSAGDQMTKRKPAPPLQVLPRYSSVLSDAPGDVAASPVTYGATVDGFSPRRTEDVGPPLPARPTQAPDKKKSGTSNPVPNVASKPTSWGAKDEKLSAAPQVILPKRKALTTAQIDNAETSTVTTDGTGAVSELSAAGPYQPQGGTALPGLANLHISTDDSVGKKFSPPASCGQNEITSPLSAVSVSSSDISSPPATGFRRPGSPASASVNRAPTITSLARPVYPPATSIHPATNRLQSKSTSLPVPPPKPTRSLSPGLLKRMPSFETSTREEPARAGRLEPRKLNLKKQSVEDLRRLYEERAGTANVLVKIKSEEGK